MVEFWVRSLSLANIFAWFEFDLFCQINMVAVLSGLNSRLNAEQKVSLICPSDFPGIDDFRGLGQLSSSQLRVLYPDRTTLSDSDLQ